VEPFGNAGGSDAALFVALFDMGALGFEPLAVGLGGAQGLALGQQEVTGEPVLDIDFVADGAAAAHALEQNDFHCIFLWLSRPLRTVRSREPSATPAGICSPLLYRVGHEADEAGALDGPGQFALLLGRNGGDAARHDLAALRDVAREQAHILVVDPGRVGAGERAGLAPALERTA